MKFVRLLLTAVCLLGFTAAAQAAEDAVPAIGDQAALEAPQPGAVTESPAVSTGACDPAATPAIGNLGGQEAIPQALNCGACSSSNCVGAPRGQMCYLGSGQGWGHCNIYSGGYMCTTGGWECQCGSGPLP